jgi:hypothetical protein
MNWKESAGNGRDQIAMLSWNLSEVTDKNHEGYETGPPTTGMRNSV